MLVKNYKLAYGKEYLNFKFPDNIQTESIEVSSFPIIEDIKKKVKQLLEDPIGTSPLKDIVNSGETVAIVVSDITRLSYKTDGYLAVVLNYLNKAGIKDQDIKIVISTGIHRQQNSEEDKLVVGEEVYNRVEIENHNCRAENLVKLSYTGRGTEITVNRTVYEADRVILTGGISYHLLAGFGGGRKSIAPGVCGYNSIQQNHSLALQNSGDSEIHPQVAAGSLKSNPVSEDMFEIAEKVGVDFAINVVMNEKKEYISVVAGDLNEAFAKGCKVVEKAYGISVADKSELVISSCGGYPKDIQLYQSVKGLDNSSYAVCEGGVIILCSECSDGTGSDEFMNWFDYGGPEEMKKELKSDFTMPGFVALRTADILSRVRVILISGLPDKVVKSVNMIPADNSEEALAKGEEILGNIENITFMPQSALTFPQLNG